MEKNMVSTYNMQEILPAPPPQTQTLVQEQASICVKFEFQT